ncbi:Uncharacterised protein [Acinetobacter junii]|uniref:HNH endonuclease n=1 Tax=Acinetobacter junii TaxID=40215 RepID=UPI0002CE2B83|nr:HNH endonuclease [Acinetobacter junii]ENV67406.1 hypothetical protein F948_00930 [Acinetobacter junii CIP 64.5]SUU19582.1 Uncharacterised protein [Acinetobacter junii]SUU22131.1 Uncharacterised protein [Acinetobacter junii]
MKYSHISSYKIDSLIINLHIWNQERVRSIFRIYHKSKEYKTLFDYDSFKNLVEEKNLYGIENKDSEICIFCHKEPSQTTFNKLPHVIPYLIGNKYLLHHGECDECNDFFGRNLECELDKYLKPYRTLNRQTNRRGNSISNEWRSNRSFKYDKESDKYILELSEEDIQFNHASKHVTFKLNQNKYIPVLVYKAFMKIFYGLLPRERLGEFELLRKWIIHRESNFIPFSPMNVMKTRLDGFSTSILDIVIIHKDVTNLQEFKEKLPMNEDLDYIAHLRFGNIIYEFPILTDLSFQKMKILKNNNLNISFNFPNIPKLGFSSEKEIIDFSIARKISTTESLYFRFENLTEEEL